MLFRRSLFGLPHRHLVGARRRNVARQLTAHRANVCDQFPNLVIGNLPREAWHSVGPALHDIRVDLLRTAAVDPLRIHQRGTDTAASVLVTATAVISGK